MTGILTIGRAHTQEVTQGRRLAHADLLAMIEAGTAPESGMLRWAKTMISLDPM